ncbi:MAG: hypothetical protein D6816_19100 [Bacteroidetes bacterium]|nr:MAG: hypothetical protein D6816_19100 [Bacteroidota bacterium]
MRNRYRVVCLLLIGIAFRPVIAQEHCARLETGNIVHILCPSDSNQSAEIFASKGAYSVATPSNYPVLGPGQGGLNGVVPVRNYWGTAGLPWVPIGKPVVSGDSIFVIYVGEVFLLREGQAPVAYYSINGRYVYFNGVDAFCHSGPNDVSDVECVNFAGETYSIVANDDVEGPSVNVGNYMLDRDSLGVHVRSLDGTELFILAEAFYDDEGRILVDTTSGEGTALFWLKGDSLKFLGEDIQVPTTSISEYLFGVATHVTSWIFQDVNAGKYYYYNDNYEKLEDITHMIAPVPGVIYADIDYVIAREENILHFYNRNNDSIENNLVLNDGSSISVSRADESGYIISGSFNAAKSVSDDDFIPAFRVLTYDPATGALGLLGEAYGGFNGEIFDLAVVEEEDVLCAGGNFTMIGTHHLPYVACTPDPTLQAPNWFSPGGGMNRYVTALTSDGRDLWAAGLFSLGEGGSRYLGKYSFKMEAWESRFRSDCQGFVCNDYFLGVPFSDIYARNDTVWVTGQFAITTGEGALEETIACHSSGCWQPFVIPGHVTGTVSNEGAPWRIVPHDDDLILLLASGWDSIPFLTRSNRLAAKNVKGLVYKPVQDTLFWHPYASLDDEAETVSIYPLTEYSSRRDWRGPIDAVETPYGWLWGMHRVFVQTDSSVVDVGYSTRGQIRSLAFFKDLFIIAGNLMTTDETGTPQVFIYSVPASQVVFPKRRPRIEQVVAWGNQYELTVSAPDSTHPWLLTVSVYPSFYHHEQDVVLHENQCIAQQGRCTVMLSALTLSGVDSLWVDAFLSRPGPTGREGSAIYNIQPWKPLVATFTEPPEGKLEFRLDDPFPNPSGKNIGVTIPYAIPKTEKVELRVYNVLGQQVARLEEGPRAPGSYRAFWDGRDSSGRALAPGLYVIELRTPSERMTRSVLLAH